MSGLVMYAGCSDRFFYCVTELPIDALFPEGVGCGSPHLVAEVQLSGVPFGPMIDDHGRPVWRLCAPLMDAPLMDALISEIARGKGNILF